MAGVNVFCCYAVISMIFKVLLKVNVSWCFSFYSLYNWLMFSFLYPHFIFCCQEHSDQVSIRPSSLLIATD